MKKRKVSSTEVAQRSGVSRTTVSFVLNNTPGKVIPEETRARVLKAVEELGYEPDVNARKMAKTMHRTIGLIISHSGSVYTDAYILRLLEGIGSVLNKQRWRLVLLPIHQEMPNLMDIVVAHGLDGVLITNILQHNIDLKQIREIYDNQVPLVIIGEVPDPDICQIDIDNVTAAATATRHLTSLAHKRIAMIVHLPLKYLGATQRMEGYRLALAEAQIPFDENLVRVANFTEESATPP
jgi:DNA-binding LacI/PurR family transcriptional regulator